MTDRAKIDIPGWNGITFRKAWTYLDKTNTPVSWEGYTARVDFRTEKDQADDIEPAIRLTTENGGVKLLAPGRVILYITAEAMAALEPRKYYYEIKLIIDSDDEEEPPDEYCYQEGKLNVKGEVTK